MLRQRVTGRVQGSGTSTESGNKPENDDGTLNYLNVDGLTYGKDGDYISLYDLYGKDVTVADVKQNDDGDYYIEKDGKQYVLGLDFLSMAMVYNCGNGTEAEQKQAYAKWWQWYIERWNKLLPEMPCTPTSTTMCTTPLSAPSRRTRPTPSGVLTVL